MRDSEWVCFRCSEYRRSIKTRERINAVKLIGVMMNYEESKYEPSSQGHIESDIVEHGGRGRAIAAVPATTNTITTAGIRSAGGRRA